MRFPCSFPTVLLSLMSLESSSGHFLRQDGAGDRPSGLRGGLITADALGHLRAGRIVDDFVDDYLKQFLMKDDEEALFVVQERQTNNNTEERRQYNNEEDDF